jgi:S1-C subfamily serine protease
LVATNAHVILQEREKELRVCFPDAPSRFLTARILLEDPRRDLALLAVSTTVPPLEIEPAYRLRQGQEVTVIGNPGLSDTIVLKNAVCRGVMSTNAVINGQNFFQLSIAINSGNSGGPVMDSSGKVIGVIAAKAVQLEGMAFCIPAADLLRCIAKAESRSTDRGLVSVTHSARFVAAWLDMVGKAYVVVLDQALTSMDRALAQRLDPTLGITQVRQKVSGPLRELEGILSNDLQPEMDRVHKDARIAPSIRNGLVEVWKNCQAMRTLIDSPEGTTKSYRARAARLRDRHGSLADRLRDDLEMTKP